MRASLAAGLVLILVGVSACGGGGRAHPKVTAKGPRTSVLVFFVRDGKLAVVGRRVSRADAGPAAAVRALLDGPTPAEARAGFGTAIPSVHLAGLAVNAGTAALSLSAPLLRPAVAQIVSTLTRLPGIRRVEIDGLRYRRGDFEDLTPAVLVESPTPGARVSSPLRVSGTSDTFEANVQLEVRDAAAHVLVHQFTTATSGNGVRGTFAATLRFGVARAGPATVVGYEISAANGDRVHEYRVAVTLEP